MGENHLLVHRVSVRGRSRGSVDDYLRNGGHLGECGLVDLLGLLWAPVTSFLHD